jgi:hypothetical protein
MTLKGTVKTVGEVVASRGQLEALIGAKMSDELEEMEAEEAREAHEEASDGKKPTAS